MFLVVVLAFDLDATGLEGEEAPSSPKASPSTLSSTLGREKRIPFFKKVTLQVWETAYGFPATSWPC
jgi:hypothetical protein